MRTAAAAVDVCVTAGRSDPDAIAVVVDRFRALVIATGERIKLFGLGIVSALTVAAHLILPPMLNIPKIAISDYKGVSYARKFPDSKRVLESTSPFGYLEVYSSSYLHFAPGLSDNAAFNLPHMPKNAYLGLYSDSEGPSGVIRELPADETGYYRFLPMF